MSEERKDLWPERRLALKEREERSLPPERLRSILSRIYPEKIVDELMVEWLGEKEKKDDYGRK